MKSFLIAALAATLASAADRPKIDAQYMAEGAMVASKQFAHMNGEQMKQMSTWPAENIITYQKALTCIGVEAAKLDAQMKSKRPKLRSNKPLD